MADIDKDKIEQYRLAFIENQQLDPIKQTDPSRIEAEMRKFGLEVSDVDQYSNRHALFFATTESEIQCQAQDVDKQLLTELQKAGADCTGKSPLELRSMYNEMFHQLIESSGQEISSTASTLLEEMGQNPDLCLQYIQSRGEALKSIDEVEAFGTSDGDQAFLSLVNGEESDPPEPKEIPVQPIEPKPVKTKPKKPKKQNPSSQRSLL